MVCGDGRRRIEDRGGVNPPFSYMYGGMNVG